MFKTVQVSFVYWVKNYSSSQSHCATVHKNIPNMLKSNSAIFG